MYKENRLAYVKRMKPESEALTIAIVNYITTRSEFWGRDIERRLDILNDLFRGMEKVNADNSDAVEPDTTDAA